MYAIVMATMSYRKIPIKRRGVYLGQKTLASKIIEIVRAIEVCTHARTIYPKTWQCQGMSAVLLHLWAVLRDAAAFNWDFTANIYIHMHVHFFYSVVG